MNCWRTIALCTALALTPALATAQAQAPAAPPSDPDVRIDPLQPDFNLAALPTTLRMPRHKLGFRVTHRFTRSLGQGDVGDLVSDFFGFDSGAQIGLELRYGLLRGTQIGVHRTSDRTTQIFGQHNLLSQRNDKPVGLDVFGTFEGRDNLQEQHLGGVGALLSRNVLGKVALYAEPIWLANTNGSTAQGAVDHTLMLGLGARARLLPSMYAVAEVSPRLAGHKPGSSQVSFGLEGRAGGHLFQINISNGSGTTPGQIASGAGNYETWYIGFNLSRKFF